MLKKELEEVNEKLGEENKELKEKLDRMEEMIQALMDSQNSNLPKSEKKSENTNNINDVDLEDDLEPIEPNKYIRVTSLCSGQLNLSTKMGGNGTVVTFHGFGQTKNIPFQALEEMVGSNRKMAENGRYYIQNERAVRLLMLDEYYENILDEKTMRAIVDNKLSKLIEVFKMAPKAQKDHLVSMIVKRVVNGGDIDYNQIHKISEIYGKNLVDMIETAKTNKK